MESTGGLTMMNSGSGASVIGVSVLKGVIKKKYARPKRGFVEIKARAACSVDAAGNADVVIQTRWVADEDYVAHSGWSWRSAGADGSRLCDGMPERRAA
jgi:hypothetical protein